MSLLVKIIFLAAIIYCSALPITELPTLAEPADETPDNSSNATNLENTTASSGETELTNDEFILDCSGPVLNTTNINSIQSGLTVLGKYITMKEPTALKVS